MALRRVLICGEPELRRKSRKVKNIDGALVELLDDMVETMLDAPGVGLAAPQVGENLRAIVLAEYEEGEEPRVHACINPRIVETEGEIEGGEGCLSLPTLHAVVLRPERVVVEGLDRDGEPIEMEAHGLMARAFCHEIDHLNGKLFIDRAEADSIAWMIPDEDDERGYHLHYISKAEAEETLRKVVEKRLAEAERDG